MKIRTLLLGTATAFVVASGAQAADLAVAEPVDYVKVCDAYGAGYFYIPGSDTCIKIGGFIRGEFDFYDDSRDTLYDGSHDSNWNWNTETSLQVTVQSMTDIGLLTGFLDYRVDTDNSTYVGQNNLGYLDTGWLKAGPVQLGKYKNIYYAGGGFGDYGVGADFDAEDSNYDQLTFNTSLGGLGFWLGIADNRDGPGSGYTDGDWPDIIAKIGGTSGPFAWHVAGAVTDTIYGTGWGAQFDATFTAAGGDALKFVGAVGNTYGAAYVVNQSPAAYFTGPGTWDDGTVWSALVSGVHYWSSTVNTSLTASYASVSKGGGNVWNVGIETDWVVAKNLLVDFVVDYVKYDDDFVWQPSGNDGDSLLAAIRVVRSW